MEQDKWSRLIVHWINCLSIPNLKIISVRDLDVKIFHQLISYLDNLEGTDNDEHNLNTVLLFLKREYPLFNGDETLEKLVEEEPVMIASLLLHYSCIKTKYESVRGAMCQRLNPVDQKAIMFFANSLMKFENITPKILKETMMVLPSSEICSPMSVTSSPDWVSSPATPLGRKGRRSRRLLHMEAALETERFDRTYLQEELRRQAARVQEMEKQHALYLSEITQLRSELSTCTNASSVGDSGTPPQGIGDDEAKLRRELRGMEQELLTVMGELATITQDGDSMKKKVAEMEKDLTLWRNRAMEFESAKETLLTHIDEDKSQISSLKMELAEKNKILEEYRLEHQLNESIECDDDTLTLKKGFSLSFNGPMENLGNAVIDVQLKEQINQNHILTNQIEEIKNEVNMTKHKLEICQRDVIDKSSEIKALIDEKSDMLLVIQTHEDSLYKLNQDVIEKVSQVNVVNQEKSGLEKELVNCHNLIQDHQKEAAINMAQISKLIESIETLENNNATLFTENADLHLSIELLNNGKINTETELRDFKLSHDKEINEVITKMDILNNTLKGIMVEKEELKKELSTLKDEQDVYKSKLQVQKSEIENLCGEKEHLIKECEVLNKKLMIGETNLLSHTQIIANVTQENLKYQNIIHLKNDDVKSLTAEVQHLKDSIADIESKLNLIEDENAVKKCEIEILSMELEKTISDHKSYIESSKQNMEEAKNFIANLTEENVKLAEINDTTNSTMHKLEEKSLELCNTINKLNEEIVGHKISIATRDREIQSSENKFSDTEQELALQLDSVQLLENKLVNLQHSCHLVTLGLHNCKEDCDLKSVKIEMLTSSNEELKTKIISKAVEVEELQKELEAERKNSSNLLIENTKIVQQHEVAKSKLSDMKTEMERKNKQNEEFSEKIKSFTADKCELLNEIDRQKVALFAFQQDAEIKNNELNKMATQISGLETVVEQNKQALSSEREKIELLMLELSNKIKNIEDHNDSIKMLTEERDQLSNVELNMKKEIIQYNNEIASYMNKIKLTEDFLHKIENEKIDLSKKNEMLSGEIISLNNKFLLLNNEKLEIQNLNNVLSEKLQNSEKEIIQYRSDIDGFLSIIKVTEDLVANIEGEKIEHSKKNEILSAEIISLNDKFVLLNNEKLEILNLNNVLSEKLHNSEKEIVQYKNDIDDFLKKIKLTEDLLVNIQDNKAEVLEKNEKLSVDQLSLKNEVVLLNSEKLEIQNINNFLSEKLQNSEKEIIHNRGDIDNYLKKMKALEDLVAKIEGEKIDLSKENHIHSVNIISLNDKFVLLSNEKIEILDLNNALSEKLHTSENEIVQYKNDIDGFLSKIKVTENLIANIESEKINHSKKNESLSAEIISLNDKFVLLNNEKLEILNLNNVLSEKLYNSEKEIVQYKNNIDGFLNKIKLTEDLLVNIQANKAELLEKNDKLSADVISLNDNLVTLKDEKLEIQSLNYLLSEKLKYFEEDCKYKSSEFATLQHDSMGLVATVERLKSELKNFEKNVLEQNQLLLEKESVIRENDSLKLQIDELQRKLTAEYDVVENIKKENVKIENDSKRYMNENVSLAEGKCNLLNEIDTQKSIIEKQVQLLASKNLVLNSLHKEHEVLNLKIKEQTSDWMDINNQVGLLQNEINVKENLIQSHEIKIQSCDQVISLLNTQLEEIEIEKQVIQNSRKEKLYSDLDTKITDSNDMNVKNVNLQRSIDSLNIKIEEQEQKINNLIEKNTELSEIIQNLSTDKSQCSELNYPCSKNVESILKLKTSDVNLEFEKLQCLPCMNVTEVYLQEISQLKLSINNQCIKLKDVESKLTVKTNENDALLREKLDLENCIDNVKLTLVGECDLDDYKEIQPITLEDNLLEFETVLLAKDDSAAHKVINSGNLKMNSIKSKLTQLCNSTEMISKTCAKNILQKDDIILKLTDEYNYLKECNVEVTSNVNQLQQKLCDIEEEILHQKIHYETQIVELETLREAEHSENVELNHALSIFKDELKSAKQEIEVFEQNEKTFYQVLYSKIQLFSDFLSTNTEYTVHSNKLESLEDKLSKTWEVICEAVKRLKEMSLPIIDEIFPPNVQLPIMNSLKFLNSVHFDNSLSIFDVLATITSSIDYIDNYVDNLCKMIVSLVQDRITCRDSLKSLEKQNNILSIECQNYKKRLESISRDKDNIARKLSEVELVKEKLEKSLNTSDAISSTTPCVQEFHIPSHIVGFIKKFDENVSRLRNILSLQGAHTKNCNNVNESLCGLNYTLNDFLGNKIALQNALKSHREIENDFGKIDTKRWMLFDKIVNFSSDLLSFSSKSLQPLRDNNEIDNTFSHYDLWIVNLEKQLEGIEAESTAIQKSILELQTTIKILETNSKKDTNLSLNYSGLKPVISVYEQLYDSIEKYILIKEELSIFKAQKSSEVESLKELQHKNVELTNENNELINKVSALRKVLKEIESKNNQLAVEKEELKYHNEQKGVVFNTEKDLHRKMTNENINLKNQISSLSTKINDLNSRFMSELDDLKNENMKLALENQKLQAKLAGGGDTNQLVTDMRNEYEDKLTRMKQKMKQLYQDQIAVYTEKQKVETASLEALCKKYSEKIRKYEDHVNQLMNEQWKVGEKLLNLKKENDELRKRLKELSGSQQSLNSITSTVSLPQARLDTRRNIMDSRRQSRRPLPSPVRERSSAFKTPNKVESGGLHMSDEEGEVFDNTYLTELRSGVCDPRASSTAVSTASRSAADNNNRLSELQWRNSLCLPHLKSSYPAELQYHSSRIREEDIKMGTTTITLDDSITVDKPRAKKEVGQTSYHKPGPPTPSKNGGRLSLQGNEVREPLKENNDCNTKKATTPSRIKSLFMGNTSKSRDENTFGTPKGRRLSIFRKPR